MRLQALPDEPDVLDVIPLGALAIGKCVLLIPLLHGGLAAALWSNRDKSAPSKHLSKWPHTPWRGPPSVKGLGV